MACITFNVTLKRDFLQNVVKTNKKVHVSLKRKTIRYSVVFIFLNKTWKFKVNY